MISRKILSVKKALAELAHQVDEETYAIIRAAMRELEDAYLNAKVLEQMPMQLEVRKQ